MANYNPENLSDPLVSSGDKGNELVSHGSAAVSAALAIGDEIRPARIAGGTVVHRVVIKNTDLDGGTGLEASIGYQPMDGSSGDDAAFVDAGAWGQSAEINTYEIFPPVKVEKDSYLVVKVTASAASGTTGTVYGKVEGAAIGVK